MTKVKEVTEYLEQIAPPSLQEGYDNARLLTGSLQQKVTGVLITLDCTEAIIDEAVKKKCNMIVAHHPIIFGGLKKLTGSNYVERTIIKAIKKDIAIYACHTNLDNVKHGVNKKIADILGLENQQVLAPKNGTLKKLVTFIPKESTEKVAQALYRAGLGEIGDYSDCSFRVAGTGTFKPGDKADPHIGAKDQYETVDEVRLEGVFATSLEGKVVAALKKAHPYEEVAYYIHTLDNKNTETGSGMIGTLKKEMDATAFLKYLKKNMQLEVIRHTQPVKQKIKRVAVCGGSGSFLLKTAKARGADVFVTADFKYHEFFDAEEKIMIADIGHYESEIFTKDLFYEILSEKFANIALRLSEQNTNPISYFK